MHHDADINSMNSCQLIPTHNEKHQIITSYKGSPVFLHIILLYVLCHYACKSLFSSNLPYFLLLNLATLHGGHIPIGFQ